MKLNNLGMTLVEMIVAFAILGLVSTSIFSMILTGTKTYTKLTNTVKLQYEAQLATANIEKRILNCYDAVSWSDAIKSLILVEDGKVNVAHWDSSSKKLYYGTAELVAEGTTNVSMYLLAEHVTNFAVSMETVTEGSDTLVQKVQFSVTLEHNKQTYTREKAVALRNLPPKKDIAIGFTLIN